MQIEVINASDNARWNKIIKEFSKADSCFFADYHLAYSTRLYKAEAILIYITDDKNKFCYPFLVSPIVDSKNRLISGFEEYKDITSVYGYTGALIEFAHSYNSDFVSKSWDIFDNWAQDNKIIAEFTRFSPYAENKKFAHQNTEIHFNRELATIDCLKTESDLFAELHSKTKNMLRKAENENLIFKELDYKNNISEFRKMYLETMDRNNSGQFFFYDDHYYDFMNKLSLDKKLKLFGVYINKNNDLKLGSSAMVLIYGKSALYHLGCNNKDYSKFGAGNFLLWNISKYLIKRGVIMFNLGGGRTIEPEDSLFKFKVRNSNKILQYYIGTRVINKKIYDKLKSYWKEFYKLDDSNIKELMFYRKEV